MNSPKARTPGVEILIAEDSATQREQLRHMLEQHGHKVTSTTNGREALEAVRRRKPTLIISDIVMPELDGYGLCRAIKADETLKDIPIILVTTLADSRDVILGLECGADNFIRKPYQTDYLLQRIDYLLMNLQLRRNQKMRVGIEISLGGTRHFITSERQQILDLLISTYEQATHINKELQSRETELAHSNDVLNGLYHIADGLNRATAVQEVADMALERALLLPGIQAGWISLREGETGFRLAAARNLPPALQAPGAMESDCECRRRLLSGQMDSVTNILECERLARAKGDTQGLRYHAAIPLWTAAGATVGIINLVGPQEGIFTDEELKILYGVGNQVAVAMERARLHEHMERLVEQRTAALRAENAERRRAEARATRLNRVYAVLSGINMTIVRTRSRQDLFEEACRIAVEHGGFRLAWIGLLDPDGMEVTPAARAGADEGYLDQIRLTVREDTPDRCVLVAAALQQDTPIVCNDVATDPRMARWRDEALRRDLQSVAIFPLHVGEKAVGILLLYAAEKQFFDTEEMRLLTEVSGDISFSLDHLEKEQRLDYLAYYDALTGLPNRTLFCDRLNQTLQVAKKHAGDNKIALVMLDLDRFHTINETFGRHAGDALLRQIAERLGGGRLGPDCVARISADTFAAALSDVERLEEVVQFVEQRIQGQLQVPFSVEGQELRLSAHTGIAMYPADGGDLDTLIRNAEAALKKAKVSGDRYLFYTPELNARTAERLKLENRLRRAVANGELALYYQPTVDLKNGTISGLEALMRWNDPDAGSIPPITFIPILEDTGLILDAGQWALEQAVADFRRWSADGLNPPHVAVNVSPLQLQQENFVGLVEQALRGGDTNEVLGLEITESLIMQDVEGNIRKLRDIRDMGVGVAIDDFGTGYSSLSYIARLPIGALKIDRTFIMNLTRDPGDVSIVTTMISLAHSLELKVIAEGVETEEQANLLRLLKCDEIQGYLFSPAVPAGDIQKFLRERKVLSGKSGNGG